MSNVTVQEALKAIIYDLENDRVINRRHLLARLKSIEIEKCEPVAYMYEYPSNVEGWTTRTLSVSLEPDLHHLVKVTPLYTSPQAIDKCEPVAQAIRERDRLGFAVVNVMTKLDEIIDTTQEVEIDDFLHIAISIDMWNELEAALEDMPKRADLYTSPQPIEKCEPVAYIHKHYLNNDKDALDWHKREHPQFKMIPLYTSPQPIEKYEPVKGVVIREGLPTLLSDKYIKATDIRLFTSPQPRDWVGLSESDVNECLSAGVDNGWRGVLNAAEVKLKQLNTKG